MSEKTLVNPTIALLQFLRRHVARPENRMGGVIQIPIAVEQTSLGFHLPEQWRGGVRSENVEGRAFEAVFLDPFRGAGKDVLAILVKAQNKRTVYLDSVSVKKVTRPA